MDRFEALLDLQVPGAVQVSPDGTRVVYSTTLQLGHKVKQNALSTIWIADVAKPASSRQLTSGLFKDSQPIWAPDSASIVFVSDRNGPGKKSALYQLHLSGGEAVPLTDPEHEQPISKVIFSPNGKYIAFLAPDEDTPERKRAKDEKNDVVIFGEYWAFNRLRVLHIRTRAVDTIKFGEVHVNDMTWSADSNSIAFIQQMTPEIDTRYKQGSDLKLVSLKNKEIKLISHCKYPFQEAGLRWNSDRVYAICGAFEGDEDTSHVLYSCSVEDGEWRKEVGGDTFCARRFSNCGDSVLTYVQNGFYDEFRTLSDQVIFRDMCNIAHFHSIASPQHADKAIVAFAYSTVNKATEVYTLTPDSSNPVQISLHGPEKPETIAVTVPIQCRSSDDKVKLEGLILAPKASCNASDRPDKPLKTFVQPHGGPYHRETSNFLAIYDFSHILLRAGYAILLTNYRGSAAYGGDFGGPFVAGTVEYDDVISLTTHAVSTGLADPSNLMIGGWSQGGYLAYLCAVRNDPARGWRFKGGVAGAGVSDWDAMVVSTDCPAMEADLAGGASWSTADKADVTTRRGSPLWEFARAAESGWVPPMLLVHGQEDPRVPVTQAWGFQRACRAWRLECTLATYPRQGHGFSERRHILDCQKRVLEFCDRHFD